MESKKSFTAEHVEIQHAYINKDLELLKNDIMKEVAAEDFSDWKLAYMWQLSDLRNTLTKHFDYEEESGFIKEMIGQMQGKRNRAVQLKNEHKSLVGILDAIMVDVKEMHIPDELQMEEIRDRVTHFIHTIHTHEKVENELINTIYKHKSK